MCIGVPTVCLCLCVFVCLCIGVPTVCLCVCVFVCLCIGAPTVCLCVCVFVHRCAHCVFVCLCVCASVCPLAAQDETIDCRTAAGFSVSYRGAHPTCKSCCSGILIFSTSDWFSFAAYTLYVKGETLIFRGYVSHQISLTM